MKRFLLLFMLILVYLPIKAQTTILEIDLPWRISTVQWSANRDYLAIDKVQTADSESNDIIVYDNRGQQTGAITINDTARRRMYWGPQDAYLMLSSTFDDVPTLILSAQAQTILELQSPAIWHPSENWGLEGDNETPLTLWDIESGEVILSATTTLIPAVFSPNGEYFLYQPDESTIATMNVSTGETKLRSILFTSQISSVVWHPDSTYVSIQSYDNQTTLWHIPTNNTVDIYNVTSTLIWHAESNHIAGAYDYTRLRLWDATTGDIVQSWDDFTAPITILDWEANWLQAISLDRMLGLSEEFHVFNTSTGQEVLRLVPRDYFLHRSLDGSFFTLATLCQNTVQYDLTTGDVLRELAIPTEACVYYISPTGLSVIFYRDQPTLMFLNEPEITYDLPGAELQNLWWHPDGDIVAYDDSENVLHIVQINRR